jgi:PhnB protein
MALNPRINLFFDGRCEAAFRFYERCLNGRTAFMLRWGESPMAGDAPPEWADKILYARIEIGDVHLSGGDALPGSYERPQGFGIMLDLGDPAESERIFRELSEDGTVTVPLQETFWALRYGALRDQFQIPWEIDCGKPEDQE